jgi:hypothetical protein
MGTRTRRSRAVWTLSVLCVCLAAAPPAAWATVQLDSYKEIELATADGAESRVETDIPFHFTTDGQFYTKLLVTPWNAVNNGSPNGTVDQSHESGVSGWWIEFTLYRNASQVTDTAAGEFLGSFVDSTATTPIALGNASAVLRAVVHVPIEAAIPGMTYRVPLALVYRAADAGASGSSGGSLDQSRGFTIKITIAGEFVPPLGEDPIPESSSIPGDGQPAPASPGTGPGADQQGNLPIGRSTLILVGAASAVLVLLVAVLLVVSILLALTTLKYMRGKIAQQSEPVYEQEPAADDRSYGDEGEPVRLRSQ